MQNKFAKIEPNPLSIIISKDNENNNNNYNITIHNLTNKYIIFKFLINTKGILLAKPSTSYISPSQNISVEIIVNNNSKQNNSNKSNNTPKEKNDIPEKDSSKRRKSSCFSYKTDNSQQNKLISQSKLITMYYSLNDQCIANCNTTSIINNKSSKDLTTDEEKDNESNKDDIDLCFRKRKLTLDEDIHKEKRTRI